MPLSVPSGVPTLLIRKGEFERVGLTRQAVDERLNLTADEFRIEVTTFVEELERLGLVYFDDFFDLSGNWPDWLKVFVRVEGA
jgi:hypothetical protein